MLLEVLNGNSSIIHGSLVLEPAQTFGEFWRSGDGRREKLNWILLKDCCSSFSISSPIDRLNSSKIDHFTWTVICRTRTRNSSFWQSHWSQPSAMEQDHQSQSHRLGDCRHCVVCVCKTREVWDLRGRISRKWWREFARIVDYLTSTWSGVWKPPPPHLPHIRPSKNLQQFHKCNSHLPIQTHLQKHTFTQNTHLHKNTCMLGSSRQLDTFTVHGQSAHTFINCGHFPFLSRRLTSKPMSQVHKKVFNKHTASNRL